MPLWSNPSFVLRLASIILLTLVVLWTGYSAGAHRRYEALNGVSPILVAGTSVGQTFVARYDDLSGFEVRVGTYGRQADPRRATLVMHLRSGPSSKDDITSAILPPSSVLEENGWYRFSFPAVEGSRGRTYYITIESPDGTPGNGLSLYWFKPQPTGDPYSAGTAYINGKPAAGDLTFGLAYSASPLEVWRGILGTAAANSSPFVLGALLVIAAAGVIWALVLLPRILEDPDRRRRWLLRWSLPFALGVALVNGLLFMLLVPPWQGPDEYSHFAYAVLLDTHDLDSSRVAALDVYAKDRDEALIKSVDASADRHDFTRLFLGSANPGAPTEVAPNIFQQVRQPATYYWLCAVAMRLARAAGAPADPYTNPEAALMAMRALSLFLGLLVVLLSWLAGALLSSGGDPWLRLLLPLTVGLLPMHTFIATVVNNDILAEVAVSGLFVSLVALLNEVVSCQLPVVSSSRPTAGSLVVAGNPGRTHPAQRPSPATGNWQLTTGRGAALVVLSLLLTLATVLTKSTATAAAIPLVVGGLLVWVATIAGGRRRRDDSSRPRGDPAHLRTKDGEPEPRLPGGRGSASGELDAPAEAKSQACIRALLVPAGVIILAGLVLVAALLLVYARVDKSASGWFVSYDPIQRAARAQSPTAHQGDYVIELSISSGNVAFQNLVPPVYHPAMVFTFSGWARLSPSQTSGTNAVQARLSLFEGEREAAFGQAKLHAGTWTHLTASGKVSASAERLRLRLSSQGDPATVQFDDLSLNMNTPGGPWNDPIYRPSLVDPSGEEPPAVLNGVVSSFLPGDVRAMADALANPQPFDKAALWRDYAYFQYRSFWGSFGWLTIYLPPIAYSLLDLLVLAALAGLVIGILRRRKWTTWASLGAVLLLSLLAAILIGFAKQMSLLAYSGLPAYPQGRYLLVLTIPLAWLFIRGLVETWGFLYDLRLRRAVDDGLTVSSPPGRQALYRSRFKSSSVLRPLSFAGLLPTILIALIFFAAYCLLGLILPFYYG